VAYRAVTGSLLNDDASHSLRMRRIRRELWIGAVVSLVLVGASCSSASVLEEDSLPAEDSEVVESSAEGNEADTSQPPVTSEPKLEAALSPESDDNDYEPPTTEADSSTGNNSSSTPSATSTTAPETYKEENDDGVEGDTYEPREFFYKLRVAPELARSGYDRDGWPHWSTMKELWSWSTSSCSVREYMVNYSEVQQFANRFASCSPVADGAWFSYYDGVWTSNPSSFDLDHIVSLAEAHDSGGANWSREQKELFANDYDNLILVSASSNRSKGDRSPNA